MSNQECPKHPDVYSPGGSCWVCAELEPLQRALEPLSAIADAYESNGLDECRPEWVENGAESFDLDKALFYGRGGKTLLRLRDACQARLALTAKPFPVDPGAFVKRAHCLFEALYIGGPTWEQLSDDRRTEFIEKAKQVLK